MLKDVRFRLPLTLVVSLLVHTTVMPEIRIAGVMPDVMLLLAVAAGLEGGPMYGALMGFASGMLADLVLATPLGLSSLVFTVVGYAVGVTKGGLLRDTWWFPVLVAFAASSAGVGLFALAASVIGETHVLNGHLTTIMLVVAVTNGILAPAMVRLVRWSMAGRHLIRAFAE